MRPATAPKNYHSVIEFYLSTTSSVNKCRRNFIIEVLWIFLSVKKLNFTQLESYTGRCEQRYRDQFSRDFDWLSFNISMVKEHCNDNLAIALDPCYIPKTGKKTEGVGRFWSGCASLHAHCSSLCIEMRCPSGDSILRGWQKHKIYFSTDTKMSAKKILEI